jgi:Leucine-rich repeat (LRR) protein
MLRLGLTNLFFLCSILIRLGSGLCPSQCKCDEARLRSDCSEGQLEIVPIFLNPRMKYLEANRNQIRHLEGALNVYEDLEVLDLSNNEFHSLGQMQFVSQLKLQQLNLSNNFVASLHSNTFVGPRALQTLDLSHNILGAIHNDTFSGLTSLVELRLSYNKIGSISSEAFSGLSRLRVLNLDHNLLESIDPTWMFALENLRFFYLNNNLISHIADDSFRPLSALKVLSVLRNRVIQPT